MFISLGIAAYFIKRDRRGRRTPLTDSLLRSPGESLREELTIHSEKADNYIWIMIFSSFLPILLLLVLISLGDKSIFAFYWQLAVCLILFVAIIVYHSRRLYQFFAIRQKLGLGLDAEMAVGQELNHLMLHGCRVFHDFYANGFNIDHVVIGPGGVIAVETKGRAKRDRGQGSGDAKVIFNGEYLRFPHWLEKNPIIQARRQAVWLQKWLTSAVGQTVKVRPALAVAGWYVERTKNGDVLVFSGKNPVFLSNPNITGDKLSPEMIQRIVHQVELRCRNVEPSAYRKEKTKM
jgi:hypothetical protein